MKFTKIVHLSFVFSTGLFLATSCTSKTGSKTEPGQMQQELVLIDSLLRDSAFTQSMAQTLEAAYYKNVGQTPPQFLTPEEETATVTKPLKEEKIATSLAGFYALECSVELLSAQTAASPAAWLQKIVNNTIDSNAALILNRFANATWKASQPFRGLNRITRYNFTGANFLSKEEVEKDAVQIRNAATKLLASLQPVRNDSLDRQMQALRNLLQDTSYAVEMAAYLDSSFSASQNQNWNSFRTSADTATIKKKVKEIKIATGIAGFYALECGLNYFAITKKLPPSAVIKSLLGGSLNKEDQMIFARFANATWKAGQPFVNLNRITRSAFTPFYFLSGSDIEKDMVQIKVAAEKLLPLL